MTQFSISNGSSDLAYFELHRLDATYEQFAQFFADAQEAIDGGEPPPAELPFDTEEVDGQRVEPGQEGELTGDLQAGTYAVLCVVFEAEHQDIIRVSPLGPYIVAN